MPDRFQAQAFDDCDVVVHLAASVGEDACEQHPRGSLLNNVNGVHEMIETLKRMREPPHLVFASSLVVYGDQDGPWTEDVPHQPLNTYAMTKCAGEHLLAISGLPHTILRFANVYGLGKFCREESLTGKYARHQAQGLALPVWGDGSQRVDMVHVRDVARACKYFAEKRIEGTFNIGSGVHFSVLDVAGEFVEAGRTMGLLPMPCEFPRKDYQIPHNRCVWVDKAAAAGWQAEEEFRPAARELIDHVA